MTSPQSSTAYNEDPRHIQDIVFLFLLVTESSIDCYCEFNPGKKRMDAKKFSFGFGNYIYCYFQLMFTIVSEVGFIIYWLGHGNWPFLQHSIHYPNTVLKSLYILGQGIRITQPRLTSPS